MTQGEPVEGHHRLLDKLNRTAPHALAFPSAAGTEAARRWDGRGRQWPRIARGSAVRCECCGKNKARGRARKRAQTAAQSRRDAAHYGSDVREVDLGVREHS